MKRFVPAIVVAAACSSYGDDGDHPLPDRSGSSSGSDAAASSSSGSSGAEVGGDAGDEAGTAVSFCKTDAAKNPIRCLDFDANPSRPFGFDQVVASTNDNVKLVASPIPGGNLGFSVTSKALPTYGVIDSLPQDNAPLSISFDVAFQGVNGTPVFAAVVGAGPNCPIDAGSLGLKASAVGSEITFAITNFPTPLGTAQLDTVIHFSLQADKRPGPGKQIATSIAMNGGPPLVVPAKLPIGCQNFSAGVGSTIFSDGQATATFDNVLLK